MKNLTLDPKSGWIEQAIHCPSPNFDNYPDDAVISLLVIHNISLPPGEFGGGNIENFFCNRLNANKHPFFCEIKDLTVSAHLLIDRQGALTQFVSFHHRAWHAGRSNHNGRDACNNFSIGIELEGTDDHPYSPAQYQTLTAVSKLIMQHYPDVTEEQIVGHQEIAPGRKTDPGPAFDWAKWRKMLQQS